MALLTEFIVSASVALIIPEFLISFSFEIIELRVILIASRVLYAVTTPRFCIDFRAEREIEQDDYKND